jgi:murein L,D-transpeptidase YcbB/YkuD
MLKGLVTILFTAVFLILVSSAQAFSFDDELANPVPVIKISELLKRRITAAGTSAKLTAGNEELRASRIIGRFYRERGFQPVWVQDRGFPVMARELIDAINDAYLEGLIPSHYHLQQIGRVLEKARIGFFNKRIPSPDLLADLDLLLTDAFLMLSCHYSAGCDNPVAMEAEWFTDTEEVDIMSVLERSFRERRIKEALIDMLPPDERYTRLKKALAEYRSIAEESGWPELSPGPLLASGAKGGRVVELRRRLLVSGDLRADQDTGDALFDDALKEAVLRFQKRHGLRTDGIVGPRTREALNVPAASRARQIELNLERLRWSRNRVDERYILVNIADFRLDVIENGGSVMSMKVVVGRPYMDTPVFSEEMTHIVFNPSWKIPMSIVMEEILPNARANSDYLRVNRIRAFESWSDNAREIELDSIDWAGVSEDNMHFILRQDPGPLNPLGRIKFLFPNRFNVYMHDTPVKGDFNSNRRSFSHGCIRLQDPVGLAEYLLSDNAAWSRERIETVISEGREMKVELAEPLSVRIIYLTAWVDDEGVIQFRDDIYGRDSRLDNYLKAQ